MNRDSGSGFFTGLVVGALIGVMVGFLYAPQSSAQTRRVVKEKAEVVKERAYKAAGRVKDVVEGRLERDEE